MDTPIRSVFLLIAFAVLVPSAALAYGGPGQTYKVSVKGTGFGVL